MMETRHYVIILLLGFVLYTIGVLTVGRWIATTLMIPSSDNSTATVCSKGWISQWNGYRFDCCAKTARWIIRQHPTTWQPIQHPFLGSEEEARDTREHLTACGYTSERGVFCLLPIQCESGQCVNSQCA